MEQEQKLFKKLDKLTKQRFKKFEKYYVKDSKSFINKINRDYKKSGKFPVHVLKMIKKINKENYDSAICILRGALPYAILFESNGWKIHYVLCGRKNEKINFDKFKLRFNKNIDKTLKQIKNKKILIIDNNSFSGNTPYRTFLELKKSYNIKKQDLFLDYFCKGNVFEKNKKRIGAFGKIFIASNEKVKPKERKRLIGEFLDKLR